MIHLQRKHILTNIPVSYTHLDVYKRQLLQVGYTLPKKWLNGTELRLSLSAQNPFTITSYAGMDPERPQIGKDGSVIETGIDGIAYPNPRTSVSYTHLDVYKRQLQSTGGVCSR